MKNANSKLLLMAELIVSGHRKRKETRCVTDNADPLLKNKKARLAAVHILENVVTKTKAMHRHPSVEIQNIDNDEEASTTQHASPKNPNHIIESVDGGDDENGLETESQATDVDDKDEEPEYESAEDELRESITKLN
jgi:hypothetical protein